MSSYAKIAGVTALIIFIVCVLLYIFLIYGKFIS